MKKGLIHIYTGDGKGKTTASFGLALRAMGQNKKVVIYQFLKSPDFSCGEKKAIESINEDTKVVRFKQTHPSFKEDLSNRKLEKYEKKLRKTIKEDFKELKKEIFKKHYDLVILDEIINAVSESYLKEKEITEFLNKKPESTEMVLTGRKAHKGLLEIADYVTKMEAVKHPYDNGIEARKGIEY